MIFEKKSEVACPAEELFAWHEHPDAFQRLMPPGQPVKVLHHDGQITNGAKAILLVGLWPLRIRWELEHRDYLAGRQFCDVQIKGPFKSYRHEHRMIPAGERACILHDRIIFEMPFGMIGTWLARLFMLPQFKRLFAYRHDVTRRAFEK